MKITIEAGQTIATVEHKEAKDIYSLVGMFQACAMAAGYNERHFREAIRQMSQAESLEEQYNG